MNTYLPTLKQLQYLVALKDHGHFGKAAESCFVTQSTLSAGLREIESLIGVTLVERTRRVVRFTAARHPHRRQGAADLREAEELGDMVRAGAESRCRRAPNGGHPNDRSLSSCPLSSRASAPNGRPQALPSRSEPARPPAIPSIAARPIACCSLLPYGCGDVDFAELFDDRLFVAFPPGMADNLPETVTAAAIDQDRLLLLEDGHCLQGPCPRRLQSARASRRGDDDGHLAPHARADGATTVSASRWCLKWHSAQGCCRGRAWSPGRLGAACIPTHRAHLAQGQSTDKEFRMLADALKQAR
jgi:LysR family hydrogen peroxide-inducible transcriptional activator